MKRILTLVAVIAVSLIASAVSPAQQSPFFGTWKLNVAKSKFSGDQPPQNATRTVVAQGNGEKVTLEGVAANGSPISYSYSSNFDGKDNPFSGTPPYGADAIVIKIVDANTHTAIDKKAGKTLITSRAVVSKDGKVLTITSKGTNAQGQAISDTTVWDKQ